MSVAEFKSRIVSGRHDRLGLCMFSPSPVANLVNRKLNEAYGDSGDNLSVPMGRTGTLDIVQYWAGNYSAAQIDHVLQTIDVFGETPGCVLLVTDPGVGAQPAPIVGLLEHGRAFSLAGEHSFFSFADSHLALHRLESPARSSSLFNLEMNILGLILTPSAPAQKFLAVPWTDIFRRVIDDPESLYEFAKNPRAFEEFIAESYVRAGYSVELTPRSGDGGVDIIAELPGHGAIRILEQTKAYSNHRKIKADEVRAALGTLAVNPSASKVIITTTSTFAPNVFKEFSSLTPTRLELRDGGKLIEWLETLVN